MGSNHTEPVHVIQRPLITEKSTHEAATHNRYAFAVDIHARKEHIKSAIESLYGVRVVGVNTQIRKGKYFRNRFGKGKTSSWKRANVTVHPDDRIELF